MQHATRHRAIRRFTALTLVVLLVPFAAPSSTPSVAQAAGAGTGTVTGRVFQDFNANGVYDTAVVSGQATDIGVAGITVRAFDRNGALVGTATSAANGTYSLSVTGADSDDLRIEFTIPTTGMLANFEPSFAGSGNGTTVQFVTLGTTDVDLGINVPGEYCQSNPYLAISRLCAGKSAAIEDAPTVLVTRYDGGPYDTSTALTDGFTSWAANTAGKKSDTGSILGMAWDASSRRVFNTAYIRRHAEMYEIAGKPVPGALFVTVPDGSRPGDPTGGSTAFLVDLETLLTGDQFSDGNLPTNAERRLDCIEFITATVGTCTTTDGIDSNIGSYVGVFEAVGKTGIGDIETDGERLWVVSLYDRNLYEVDLPQDGSAPTVMRSLGSIATPVNCTNGQARPFSVRLWRGALYLGVVCDGSADFDAADPWTVKDANLSFTILRYDLDAGTFSTFFGPHPLNAAGKVQKGFTASNGARHVTSERWNPWTDFYPDSAIGDATTRNAAEQRFNQRPVPLLSEIEFDRDGSMILGFRDRTGDQSTTNGSWTPSGGNTGYPTISSGDIYRVCRVGSGYGSSDYAFEGTVAECPQTDGAAAGNGVEFYSGDAWLFVNNAGALEAAHAEISAGMLAQVPGFPDVILTGFDPFSGPSNGVTVFYSGGIRYLSNTTGGPAGFPNGGDGVMIYSSSPPLNSGLSWNQTGPQTGGFMKVNGMSDIEALCDLAPVQIGNRVWIDTNRDGIQDPGEPSVAGVTVRLYDSTGALVGTAVTDADGTYYFSSNVTEPAAGNGDNVGGGLTIGDTFTVRLDNAADYEEGGPLFGYGLTSQFQESGTDEVRSDAVDSNAFVGVGGFPTIVVPAREAGFNDHTFDVGFVLDVVAVGDVIWIDADRDGIQGDSETGLGGVTITLFLTDGTPATRIDGSPATTESLEDGSWVIDGLLPGDYVAQFELPNGYVFTSDLEGGDRKLDSNPDPTTGLTAVFTIEDDVSGDTVEAPAGVFAAFWNPTIDAGVVPLVAVGDVIWIDADRDGIQDDEEDPLGGVTITLFLTDGVTPATRFDGSEATTVSLEDGSWVIDGLLPGDYVAQFVLPNGYVFTSALQGGDEELDSNADPRTGLTPVFTIEGSVSGDTVEAPESLLAAFINPTIDAGVVLLVAVGDVIWIDADRDGIQGDAEGPLGGVTITLFLADGETPATRIDGSPATTVSLDDGSWVIDGLLPGDYVAQFELPNGYVFTSALQGEDGTVDSNPEPTDDPRVGVTAVFTIADRVSGDTVEAPAGVFAVFMNPTIDAGVVRIPDEQVADIVVVGGPVPRFIPAGQGPWTPVLLALFVLLSTAGVLRLRDRVLRAGSPPDAA